MQPLLVALSLCFASTPARPGPPGKPSALRSTAASPAAERLIRVGSNVVPPFSMRGPGNTWSGISQFLWREVARELRLKYRIDLFRFRDLLPSLERRAIDVAVGALTITADREKRFDFTHPVFSSGLGIAVKADAGSSLWGAVKRLLSLEFLQAIAGLLAALFVAGLLVWFFERRRNAQFGGGAARGIGSSFWWSAVTMTTVGYGDKVPVTTGGRIVALVSMFIGLVAISSFTGAVASLLTVRQLESRIRGVEDLHRVRTATVAGTVSASQLRERGIAFREFPSTREALAALSRDELDAVVYDAPILRYRVARKFSSKLRVLPQTFWRQDYGFALHNGSPLREPINRVLLKKIHGPQWKATVRRYLGRE